jgi:quercetin dioxygenase-like cupin family protein
MAQPEVNIGTVANVFVRQMHFAASGDQELGHGHPYDHLTLLAKGQMSVLIGDKETMFTAPSMIYIEANTQHTLTAASENTVAYCIHALREPTGDIIAPNMVPQGAALFEVLSALTTRDA